MTSVGDVCPPRGSVTWALAEHMHTHPSVDLIEDEKQARLDDDLGAAHEAKVAGNCCVHDSNAHGVAVRDGPVSTALGRGRQRRSASPDAE